LKAFFSHWRKDGLCFNELNVNIATKTAWLLLAFVHALPAAVLFRPQLTQQLYGVVPQGDVGLLLVHRGALFLAVSVLAVFAAFNPSARRAAAIVVAISVMCFLVLYARAGFPAGALRTIALVDFVAVLPLIWVSYDALKPNAA
jgi:hypothetical protein